MSLQLGRNEFGNASNKGKVLSREAANALLNEWVLNERLKLHMRQVAHLMQCWASEKERLDENAQWRWELAGLLHDADWDQWPDLHCKKIIEELESREIDPEIIRAIASHGPAHFGVIPITRMDKMLYAVDELSGLIHAYALMRPERYERMERKGVLKRLKEKSFAANVNRDEIRESCSMAGVALEELIDFIIANQGTVE